MRLEFGAFAARKLLRALPEEGGADRQARAYREYNHLNRAREEADKGSANVFAVLPLPSSHCIDETPDVRGCNDLTGEYSFDM